MCFVEGGIEEGTTTIVTGPAGVGKTTLALQLAWSVVQKGERRGHLPGGSSPSFG